ncbi:copper-translocating P-type ATPase [Cutibacterium sp. WCA-380-WT-3A]|uniref:Copper-translocating P-type ATPase n=1 Tax=Cutibacterium porci TaxID=2605781 RepID=A0A7K0J9G3_9ACTN|nr:heavy metal translocating P-type ATPase [Cutibacterium porci]MSS46612.1 copper-translocating P-type ATPase [Cutibacterium porci]
MTSTTVDLPDKEQSVLHPPVQLQIGGMTCAACATTIEKRLSRIEGVHASVNFVSERATVTGIDVEHAIAAVNDVGYTAALLSDVDLAAEAERRITMLRRRLIVAVLLTLPLMDIGLVLALEPQLRFPAWDWLLVALSLPVVFWSAWPFHKATWSNLRHGMTSMDTLVSLGVLSSFGWSLIAIVIGAQDHEGYWLGYGITPAGADTLYLDVAAGVTCFLLAGRYFEARAKRSARSVLMALGQLAAKNARVLRDGVETVIPVEQLSTSDLFVARSGETLPADGVVVEGSSSIDASMMTGEPIPTDVTIGSTILGGTMNLTGRIVVRATGVGAHSQLAHMAVLAEEAQARKANVQRLVDKIVEIFVPAVLAIVVLTFFGWWITGVGTRHALSAALSVLVIACPCALGLATPTALMVGVGRGGQLGILIKGPEALEASGRIDTVVFDKTGTVTSGDMTLVTTIPVDGHNVDRALRYAAALDQHSTHPVAKAVVAAAEQTIPACPSPRTIAGRGVIGDVEGHHVMVGNRAFLAEGNIEVPDKLNHIVLEAATEGRSTALVAIDGQVAAALVVADTVKPEAPEVIAQLKAMGLRTVLLTGDSKAAAEAVGTQLGIDEVLAEVLPTDKADIVEGLRAKGHVVAMVGDGINDAAALASSDLGMALVSGTDIAMRSADIICVRHHLGVVVDAIGLSRRTLRTIQGNLAWAFIYNIAAIPIAAAGLLNPLISGLAMSLSSLFVVVHSLRLRNFGTRS